MAGWVDPKRDNRLGFRIYKDNDTGEIIATRAVDQGAREVGADYLKDDPFAEAVVSGAVLKREGVLETAGKIFADGLKFNLNPGGRDPIIADQDVYDAVARACKTSRTKTEALRKANDELRVTRADGVGLVKQHCNNADEMMRRRYVRAFKNRNLPPYPHLAD